MTPGPGTELVATLVAGAGGSLSPELLKQLAGQVSATRTAWLADGEAADIFCASGSQGDLRNRLKTQLDGQSIDVIVQDAATRRKKFLAADMESTIIEQEMLDELAAMLGMGEQVAEMTRRAMNGEMDFALGLRERIVILKGQPVNMLDEAAKLITDIAGAETLLATLRAHNVIFWLISGGFTHFASIVGKKHGFHAVHANELTIEDGKLLGAVTEPLLDRNRKRVLLEQAARELNISLSASAAVGDGANDIPMLETCHKNGGLGVAYHAKPNVRAVIPNQINYGDLTALLYAQGYKREEFTSSSRT